MDWLDGFEYVVFEHSLGFPYIRDVRAVCWHLTQGHKAEHAYNVYRTFPSCPHITCDRREASRVKAQHVPLSWASYALRNLPGGCELGSTGIIQIEVVGFKDEAPDWPQHELRWLGEEILAPILKAYPNIPPFVYKGARMSCDEWNAWGGGQVGHKDCPENDHTDPGELDVDVILEFALRKNDTKDEALPEYILRDATDLNHPWIAVYPEGNLRHIGGDEAGHILATVPNIKLVDERDTPSYLRAVTQSGSTV